MARARNLKPSFFTNDALAEVPPLGRLLFAGLWCMADRAGRLEDRPKRIKAEVLPYDTCEVDELLDGLAVRGFLIRYEAAGVGYIQVTNFERHQDPHVKEKLSTIPPPCEHVDSTVAKPLTPDSGLLTPDSKTREEAPEGVFPHVWKEWKKHRGKALSKESIRRQTERLAELKLSGDDPNAVILQSIERSWSGLFPLKRQVSNSQQTRAEKRSANIDSITGKTPNGRGHIDSTAELLDSGPVPTLPGDLREQGDDHVGRRRP